MENLAQIVSIPAILFIVYGILAFYNRVVHKRDGIWKRLIPLWAFLLGIFLSIFVFTMYPEIMPAPSLFTSVMLGAIAGLAATGLNQLMYQLFGKTETDESKEEKPTEDKKEDDTKE